MTLAWTKKHIATVAEVLDKDYETLGDAAEAALDAALSIIEERGKFAVVGQVHKTAEHGEIPNDHPASVKVCIGLYESDTKANEAAALMAANVSGDLLNTWVVPTYFGTPAGWHKERRDYYAGLEAKADEKRHEKLRASIIKHEQKGIARLEAIRAMEEAAGQMWPCPSVRAKQGKCKHNPSC